MKTKQNTLTLCALVLSIGARAASTGTPSESTSFQSKCPDIGSCASAVGQLLGQKYMYDPAIDTKKIQTTRNLELTRENAEVLFTSMLHLNGYTRVPLAVEGSYQIVDLKAALQTAIPVVSADAQNRPNLPPTWDYVTLKYKLTNPAIGAEIQRFITDYLPRMGRASHFDTGYLFITAAGPEVERVYELLGAYDQKFTAETKKAYEARKAEAAARARDAAKAAAASKGG